MVQDRAAAGRMGRQAWNVVVRVDADWLLVRKLGAVSTARMLILAAKEAKMLNQGLCPFRLQLLHRGEEQPFFFSAGE